MTTSDVEALAEALASTNPFEKNRVTRHRKMVGDVPYIHEPAFDAVIETIEDVRTHGSARGLVLLGDVGVGKSHLIGRLLRWAPAHDASIVVLHNVMATPERMPRYLLGEIVDELTTPFAQPQESALYRYCYALFVEGRSGAIIDPTIEQVAKAYFDNAARLALGKPDEGLSEAYGWLRGDRIDAPPFGLSPTHRLAEGLFDDADVEAVLIALAQLAARSGEVLVVALDQMDNLSEDQVLSLSSFLHALLDHADNLVVLTAGVRASMESFKLRGRIPEAAWDRLAEREVTVDAVSVPEGEAILGARINTVLHRYHGLPAVETRRAEHPLFPIRRKDFQGFCGDAVELRPREIVSFGRMKWSEEVASIRDSDPTSWLEQWEDLAHVTPVSRPELIVARAHEALAEAHRPSFRAEDWAKTVYALLVADLFAPETKFRLSSEPEAWGGHSMLISALQLSSQGTYRVGQVFSTARGGNQGWSVISGLAKQLPTVDRLVLVTHPERAPLRTGPRGSEELKQLIASQKFSHVKVRDEDLSSLQAAVNFLGDADAGKLEVETAKGALDLITTEEARAALKSVSALTAHPVLQPLTSHDDFVEEVWGQVRIRTRELG